VVDSDDRHPTYSSVFNELGSIRRSRQGQLSPRL
jgi:hypothetical protein